MDSDTIQEEGDLNQRYEIVIREHLQPAWAAAFAGMRVTCLPDGNTRIAGSLPDQAALYGLLMRLRDFGLALVSVNTVHMEET